MSCYSPRCALVPPKGSPIFIGSDEPVGTVFHPEHGRCRVVYIPCGGCLGCRLDRRRDLTALQLLEASQHTENWFVTLTYEDWRTYELTGEVPYSLVKPHLSQFIENMRHYAAYRDEDFRFLACGEYGEKYNRPHYHLSIFGLSADCLRLPTDDLGVSDRRKWLANNGRIITCPAPLLDANGNQFWQSPTIGKYWPFGSHKIYRASPDTYQYVAGYVTKKLRGEAAKKLKNIGLFPEFLVQSRPSIGFNWFIRNFNSLSNIDNLHNKLIKDDIQLPGFSWRIPRIFDKWLERLDTFDAKMVLNRIKYLRTLDAPLVPDRDELARKKDLALCKAENEKINARRNKLK